MTAKRLFVGRKTVEDRFTIINDYENEIGVKENRSGNVIVLKHSDLNAQQFVTQLVVFLNDQNQAIVDLYDRSKFWSDKATERIKELEEENEELKKQLDIVIKQKEIKEDYLKFATNELDRINKENEQLNNRVDKLEDDNIKYTLSTEKLESYTKRFIPTKCINEFRDCKTNRYYWLDHENNFDGALELLNLLDCENEQLKQTINKIKESIKYLKNKGRDVTLADVDGTLNKINEILNGDVE